MRPVKAGKGVRMTFSRQKEVLEMPNLIEIQKNSYQWFLDEGLREVFADISPIADFAGHLSLDFVDFTLCKDCLLYTSMGMYIFCCLPDTEAYGRKGVLQRGRSSFGRFPGDAGDQTGYLGIRNHDACHAGLRSSG